MSFVTDPIVIRTALPEDAAPLSELARRSKAHWGYSRQFLDACNAELTVTVDNISDGRTEFWVCEKRGAVVGYYALRPESGARFELDALFVEPANMGAGVGGALMRHAIDNAAKQGANSLIVQSDPNAIDFYRAAGGELVGQRESGSIPNRFLPLIEFVIQPTL